MNKSIRTLAALGLLSVFSLEALDPAPLQNYCPVVVVNNTTLDASKVYFVCHGNDPNGVPCFLVPNTGTGICEFVYPTPSGSPSSAGSSVTLDQLPVATGISPSITNAAYLIYLPINSSSRGYFSINSPMYLATALNPALGVLSVNDSSVTALTDPNFYTLYQDFEFGLVNSPTSSISQLYLNLSWVDYFCLPMQLTTYMYPSNTEVSLDPVALPSGTESSLTRENIIASVNASLAAKGSPWNTLGVAYLANPYIDTTSSNYVRILAMKNSIDLGGDNAQIPFSGGSGYTPQACFPSTYFSAAPGPTTNSYMQEVYNYYLTNALWVQIYPKDLGTALYKITSDSSDPTNQTLTFTGVSASSPNPTPPTCTLQLANLTAEKFLSGSVWPFNPASTNAAYTNELSKVISALFTIGQFPLTKFSTSQGSPFVNNNEGFSAFTYFSNPIGTWSGIWYNLYCELLHKLMISQGASSLLNLHNPTLGLGYAYDYDDLLNMSGLIQGISIQDMYGNPSQATGAVQPYVVISLESLSGTTIPDISGDSYAYPVTVAPAANGVQVSFTYFDGTSTVTTQASQNANVVLGNVQVDSGHPFLVTFSFGSTDNGDFYSGTFNINLLRQVVTPQTTTSSFSTTDQYFQGSIVFDNQGSNTAPKFFISYNSTPPGWPG